MFSCDCERPGGSQHAVVPFEEFYATEKPALLALAGVLLGSREAARDVVQEASLRAFRDWSRVSRLDRPGAWVRRGLINLTVDAHRRRQREARTVSRLAVSAVLFEEPDVDEFWRFVRDLPPRQRTAVALRYIEDLSIESIAEVLDISVGTVTKSLFMARKTLTARIVSEEALDDKS